jgi:hypothetical protein
LYRACELTGTSLGRVREESEMANARQVRLKLRPPPGPLGAGVFEISETPMPEPGPGEFRVKVSHISLDPAMRGWVSDAKSYVPPVPVGGVMRAYAAGIVDASRNPEYNRGDAVQGLLGVQTHAISNGERIVRCDTRIAPIERWIGGLGMPGWTAYFGLLEVGQPKAGETVVVSAASGAVGSIVGQIAKIKGCRVVGIAGGAEKCRLLTATLGFDAAVDHTSPSFAADLAAACPAGIDVDFENVGGAVLDSILPLMNRFGRIPLCGTISAFSAAGGAPAPLKNYRAILTQRLRLQGLIVFDWESRIPEAVTALAGWQRDGKLVIREDVRTGGLEKFPETLNLLYTGGNNGKLVLAL